MERNRVLSLIFLIFLFFLTLFLIGKKSYFDLFRAQIVPKEDFEKEKLEISELKEEISKLKKEIEKIKSQGFKEKSDLENKERFKEPSVKVKSSKKECDLSQLGEPKIDKIIFNEICWMGSENSAYDEWIELKNISKNEIDLEGWQILNRDAKIKILLEGKIPANDFFILERREEALPEILADFIFSGAIKNEDEALYLFDQNCQLQDIILALPNWPAGDSKTKRTMERKSDFSWQTSENPGGTPKAENSKGYFEKEKEKEPKINLSFEKEIFSNQDFEVLLSIFDLEDAKYDLKISVEKDGKNLSEIYNQRESKWQSSFYYLKELFSGSSFIGKFKLRVQKDFEGVANLVLKIRNSESRKISAELSEKIEISKPTSEIENQLPIASFNFSPENPVLAQEILFDASLSKDPDGQISKFIWDFGDGERKEINQSSTTHSFLSSGSFIVTLVVVDNQGANSPPNKKTINVSRSAFQQKEPKISLSFPKEIILDQEFNVNISLFDLENKSYDIKISIEKEGKTLSRIYDPKKGWKSSFYYILNVFENSHFEGQFKMEVEKKAIEDKGFQPPLQADILAKIRESGTKKIVLETLDKIEIKSE